MYDVLSSFSSVELIHEVEPGYIMSQWERPIILLDGVPFFVSRLVLFSEESSSYVYKTYTGVLQPWPNGVEEGWAQNYANYFESSPAMVLSGDEWLDLAEKDRLVRRIRKGRDTAFLFGVLFSVGSGFLIWVDAREVQQNPDYNGSVFPYLLAASGVGLTVLSFFPGAEPRLRKELENDYEKLAFLLRLRQH